MVDKKSVLTKDSKYIKMTVSKKQFKLIQNKKGLVVVCEQLELNCFEQFEFQY